MNSARCALELDFEAGWKNDVACHVSAAVRHAATATS